MAANRGFDVKNSKSRDRLIDATEALLAREGGHAISARRIAQEAGLKPQLVHYYFRSMEDLLIATFDRATAHYQALHDKALASPQPLRAFWTLNHVNRSDTGRNIEFIALGNRHERLRQRMLETGEHFRALQIEAVEKALEKETHKSHYSAAGLAMMISAAARTIVMENRLGISLAHAELCELIGMLLDEIEPRENGASD